MYFTLLLTYPLLCFRSKMDSHFRLLSPLLWSDGFIEMFVDFSEQEWFVFTSLVATVKERK